MEVRKRDGKTVPFDRQKIETAILKAFAELNKEEEGIPIARDIAREIEASLCDRSVIDVEEIQDEVEERLMMTPHTEIARAYITYRYLHSMARDRYSDLMKVVGEKLSASNVQNQNANVDEKSFGGRAGEASNAVARDYALNYLISPKSAENHNNNEIYIHDLSSYALGNHNCLSVPFDKLLAEGFEVKQTDVRPAQSVNTAFQLVAVIFQLQSLQQFGGVSATHLDWTMVPYVRKSFFKHFKDGLKYLTELDDADIQNGYITNETPIDADVYKSSCYEKPYQYAMDMTERECRQAVEGMYHNLNTLQSRSGNQLPFTSINYGTCALPEGRMVIKAILEASIDGMGKLRRTSIFPCGIFQCMKGVNRAPDDPNYDLFRLALKSTSLRLYPNYADVDWSGNQGYDKNDPKTYFSTMGCVDGGEIVTYKFKDRLYVEAFSRMWNRVSEYCAVKTQADGVNAYIEPIQMQIYDSKNGFTAVKKVIRNTGNVWLRVKMSGGRSLLCTVDHPFPTGRGRIPARDLQVGDTVTINKSQYAENTLSFAPEKAWLLGFVLCDGCYDSHLTSSIALEGEDDIQEAYISRMKQFFDIDVKCVERRRGVRGNYKDLCGIGNVSGAIDYLSAKFEGLTKNRRHIPNEVFEWDKEARFAFLAGMIDADGYINSTGSRPIVQIGSTNKELALQEMALAQSLGMPTGMFLNHYSKIKPDAIRYAVEFVPCEELVKHIVSQKKKDHFRIVPVGEQTLVSSSITEILPTTGPIYSYDVETGSDHFEVSGIWSHNCRTANGYDINGFAQLKDGRGNICPVTIIMPTLAMEAKGQTVADGQPDNVVDAFMSLLDKKIHEAKDMLLERFEWICSQPPESAAFMYKNGTMSGYVPEEGTRSALKHGTLAIGQIGLAETLQILIGCDHTEERGMELAKRIERLFKDRCAEFKQAEHLNFGVYYSPAENLCYTAMQKFKERYGVITNVSDKDFFTNSMHVPVWRKINPIEKIDIESQLTGYSSAGCITYVELDSSVKHNIDGLEALVNYAMDKDIPYFAINVPNDTCMDCGYTDEIGDNCPVCGGTNIYRLRRITGYLSTDYSNFNKGKQQEVEMRVKHDEVMEK